MSTTKKDKYDVLTDGERKGLFHLSLLNPDLYPDKKKKIPIELEGTNKGKENRDFTILGLIGFVGLVFHILEHEYFDSIKQNEG